MGDPKPFPCKVIACPQSFATEDHLAVHLKTHEMMLNLNLPSGSHCFMEPQSLQQTCSYFYEAFYNTDKLKQNSIVDKTPTPSRLLENLAEVGLFEENIFDETFRRAIEEKQNPCSQSTSCLRRAISHQNEDTLHTPHIPLHLYKSLSSSSSTDATTNGEVKATGGSAELIDLIEDPGKIINTSEEVAQDNETKQQSSSLSPQQPSPIKPRRAVKKRRKGDLDQLLPPPQSCSDLISAASVDPRTPTIPINYPDEIQIQPKWTVMLQYPAYQTETSTATATTVKQKLQSLLVRNDSSKLQTVTLTPPTPTEVVNGEIRKRGMGGGHLVEVLPTLKVFSEGKISNKIEVRSNENGDGGGGGGTMSKVVKSKRPYTKSESNTAAVKRYRSRKKEQNDNLVARNKQLEEENRRLRVENRELVERLEQVEGLNRER